MNKLYPLRYDIRSNLIEYEGKDWVLLDDPMGYAEAPVIVTPEFFNILVSIDEELDIRDILKIENQEHGETTIEPILAQIKALDDMGFILSESFYQKRALVEQEYLASNIRPAVCAGTCYPADPKEIEIFLNEFFKSTNVEDFDSSAHSIIVPHIDFRLGDIVSEVYSSGYHSISGTDSDLFIIFGTSHFINSGQFMLTRKNFETPLGIVETDNNLIDFLYSNCPDSCSIDDLAHKPEHSIELQVILLQHYFKNRNFKILPVVVGSMHQFMAAGTNPAENREINTFIKTLQGYISANNIKASYIASVDFAHIGIKFEDTFDAVEKLDEVKSKDYKLIDSILNIAPEDFYSQIAAVNDKWKICGTAPIYSFLKTNAFTQAKLNKYNQWYEAETQSAVTFASLSFYD
jgi:MEMO1 family protein